MRFIPHTEADVAAMLAVIGAPDVESLFASIPASVRLGRELNLPQGFSEAETLSHLGALAKNNAHSASHSFFLGAGVYSHYIPSVVNHLASKPEFSTSYTPYQAEISQGTLQAIYEYQTLLCQLTGMDVANASLYEGASATAEACLMAMRLTGRHRVVMAKGLHPEYRQVVDTYLRHTGGETMEVGWDEDGRVEDLSGALNEETAALLVQSPNFFGVVEDLAPLVQAAHDKGALFVHVVTEGISLGLLKASGDLGADIVAGEGQSFGIPMSFGGPFLGLFATREAYVRQMPGRLVGQTVDTEGRRGYVLTVATREQHIRRAKATSNICTNEGLCALRAAVYLSALGRQGLRELAVQNALGAERAKKLIQELPGFEIPFSAPTFNEFVVKVPFAAAEVTARLRQAGILGGLDLGRWYPEFQKDPGTSHLLFCVTEENPPEAVDVLVGALRGLKSLREPAAEGSTR